MKVLAAEAQPEQNWEQEKYIPGQIILTLFSHLKSLAAKCVCSYQLVKLVRCQMWHRMRQMLSK